MSKQSPTKLTLDKLRHHGAEATVVEHWNAFAHVRQDMFGFADIVYVTHETEVKEVCASGEIIDTFFITMHGNLKAHIVAIQCTTFANRTARRKKILANKAARAWVLAGGLIEVWAWKLQKRNWITLKGKTKVLKVWEPVIESIKADDFKAKD